MLGNTSNQRKQLLQDPIQSAKQRPERRGNCNHDQRQILCRFLVGPSDLLQLGNCVEPLFLDLVDARTIGSPLGIGLPFPLNRRLGRACRFSPTRRSCTAWFGDRRGLAAHLLSPSPDRSPVPVYETLFGGVPPWSRPLPSASPLHHLAGPTGLEPATCGFGDRCSTNWATALGRGVKRIVSLR